MTGAKGNEACSPVGLALSEDCAHFLGRMFLEEVERGRGSGASAPGQLSPAESSREQPWRTVCICSKQGDVSKSSPDLNTELTQLLDGESENGRVSAGPSQVPLSLVFHD